MLDAAADPASPAASAPDERAPLATLPELQQLKQFSLEGMDVGLVELAFLAHASCLRRLDLNGFWQMPVSEVHYLEKLSQLGHLSLQLVFDGPLDQAMIERMTIDSNSFGKATWPRLEEFSYLR